MLIEDWSITKVRPYPNNPRVLRNAAEKVAESIKAFGWRQPIVVDAEGVIIAGHGRHAAAQLLKLKTVPVHVAHDLTPDQVRALRIADNKTATFSEWDDDKLADELAEIMGSLDGATFTGFSQSELDAIIMQASAEVVQASSTGGSEPEPSTGGDAHQPEDPDDVDEPLDTEPEQPGPGTGTGGDEQTQPEFVPFNALLTVENRQVVYEAIARAKQQHGMETTGEALLDRSGMTVRGTSGAHTFGRAWVPGRKG